jgi:hypothetical protein
MPGIASICSAGSRMYCLSAGEYSISVFVGVNHPSVTRTATTNCDLPPTLPLTRGIDFFRMTVSRLLLLP